MIDVEVFCRGVFYRKETVMSGVWYANTNTFEFECPVCGGTHAEEIVLDYVSGTYLTKSALEHESMKARKIESERQKKKGALEGLIAYYYNR